MVNIHLENAIRQFIVACYFTRHNVNRHGVQTTKYDLSDVLKLGSKTTLGRMTGLSSDELQPIIEDELKKLTLTIERTNELKKLN
ncbi:MAG: hypothetical protein ACK5NH_14955 [Shewanella sp.]